jgi:hypothetical protein
VLTHDQLLDEHGLSDPGATEETNLSTTSIWSKQVDDLDTRDEHFGGRGLFDELGSIGVNGCQFGGFDGASLIDGIARDVHDTTEGARTDGDSDGRSGICSFVATNKTFGTCADA